MNKILKRKKGMNVTDYTAMLVDIERKARYTGNYSLVDEANQTLKKLIETEEYKNDLKQKLGII